MNEYNEIMHDIYMEEHPREVEVVISDKNNELLSIEYNKDDFVVCVDNGASEPQVCSLTKEEAISLRDHLDKYINLLGE